MLRVLLPGGLGSFAKVPLGPLAGCDMSSTLLHMVRFLGTQRVEIQSEQASIHWTDLTINTVFFFFF
jgi:hypothetical protein